MDAIVGSGSHTYDVNENWASVPDGIDFKPAAVAVDSRDRVFCFNRSATHPVVIRQRVLSLTLKSFPARQERYSGCKTH